MEQRFGHDFGRVRVHSDPLAARSASALGADAYTFGSHLVFGPGRYTPATAEGERLLAHELAHVVQQTGNSGPPQRLSELGSPSEREADSLAAHATRESSQLQALRPVSRATTGTVQRQPARGQAGFGNTPTFRGIRVGIVGHASPRWRGAASDAEADRLNQELSERRANTVRKAVEAYLRQELGQDIEIVFDLSRPDDEHSLDLQLGSSAKGSGQTLEEVGGDRRSNQDYSRRVELDVDLFSTKLVSGGVSVPAERMPAFTKFWYVAIKKLLVSGIAIEGPAAGWVELELRNSLSGKKRRYRAVLWGGGDPLPQDTPDTDVGREATFVMDEEMGFDEFDDEFVRIERLDAQVGVGATIYFLRFPNLGSGAANRMSVDFGVGYLGGYIVSGTLDALGDNPGDFYEVEDSDTDTAVNAVERRASEGLVLNFPTGSAKLTAADQQRLEQFLAVWVNRLHFGPP